jgi:hypothetical protein
VNIKKTTIYCHGNQDSELEQAKICGGFKPIEIISKYHSLFQKNPEYDVMV